MTKRKVGRNTSNSIRSILKFITVAEKLKKELRHSWTSNPRRQESVAEHTWMMSLLAITLFNHVKITLDHLKCLKMIIIHDLTEAIIGDIPTFEKSIRQTSKRINEAKAIRRITDTLDDKLLSQEMVDLWEEFEIGKSAEAQFAQAIDKVEVLIQHNNANIETWKKGDFELNPYYMVDKFDFDGFMRLFKDAVDADTMRKISLANSLHRVSKKHRRLWERKKI